MLKTVVVNELWGSKEDEPRYFIDKWSLLTAFGDGIPIDTIHYGPMVITKITRRSISNRDYMLEGYNPEGSLDSTTVMIVKIK